MTGQSFVLALLRHLPERLLQPRSAVNQGVTGSESIWGWFIRGDGAEHAGGVAAAAVVVQSIGGTGLGIAIAERDGPQAGDSDGAAG